MRFIALLFFLGTQALAATPTLADLNLHRLPSSVSIGLLVSDVKTGKTLVSHRADEGFIPASTIKLVTAASVFSSRGQDGWWSTELSLSGNQLILRGSNDPTLQIKGSHSLEALVKQAYQNGLRTVDSVAIRTLHNGVPSVQLANWQDHPPKDIQAQTQQLTQLLIDELRKAGIHVRSQNISLIADNPSDEQGIARVQSASPVSFIMSTLRPSDNNKAEALLRTLTDDHNSAFENQLHLLRKMNLPLEHVKLVDGSGLDAENRLTPRFLNALLKRMYDLPYASVAALPDELYLQHQNEFIAGLPRAGVGGSKNGIGGTLASRLVGRGIDVRAKTGTLYGVSTLSGYLKANSGRLLAFTLMMNGPETTSILQLRKAQDTALQKLAEWY